MAEILPDDILNNNGKTRIISYLINHREQIKEKSSKQETIKWLELIDKSIISKEKSIKKIDDFVFTDKKLVIEHKKMFVRNIDDNFFFTSSNYDEKISLAISEELPFEKVSNRTDIYFEYDDKSWKMKSRNPSLKLIE